MPDRDLVRRALQAIKRRADYEYFFDQLKSPDWIEPLLQEGLFGSPTEPVRDGEYVRFPFWPESRYLARVSAKAPERVLRVILSIPDTENVRVHEDFIDAAVAMPPELAAQVVDRAVRWLDSPYQLLLPHKLGELLIHLARGNQTGAALKLARALLRLRAPSVAEDESRFIDREPQPRFQEYEYEQILKRHVPLLVEAAGKAVVELLAELLDEANRIASRPEGLSGAQRVLDDYSYVWRPAVEEHEQNHVYRVRDHLVAALRDALEWLATNDPSVVPAVLEDLERRRWIIFYRLALHLLRCFPSSAPAMVVERAIDEWRFDDSRVRHEYGLLLRTCFPLLPEWAQRQILDRIDAGPALHRFKSHAEEVYGRPPTDEEVRGYVRHWKLERLALIGESHLPGPWGERYRQWAAELGEPEHPEFPVYSTGMWRGPTSPKTGTDLRTMPVGELITLLENWEPECTWMSPSREGLGRALQEAVGSEPQRFVEAWEGFKRLRPVYVRALLTGLREASKEKAFAWRPILALCEWVINQADDDAARGRQPVDRDEDPDWSWSRSAVVDLLEKGLATGPAEIPFELRTQVWRVLEPLTADPDPTPEYEARYGGPNMDPPTLALNTVRGAAMHALMRYGVWVRRHIGPNGQARGFEEMPEVRTVLEEHLDPMRDSSLAIRSVYGRWLPWLINWDRGWAQSRLGAIFPRDERLADFRDVAWDTYVVFSPAYDDTFELLKDEYRLAINRIGQRSGRARHGDPDENLGQHLVVLFWRGLLSLAESDSTLVGFFAKANSSTRTHLMRFVGISLQNTEGEVSSDIRERLKAFWSWRVAQVATARDVAERAELAEFGWWYASGKMEDAWALDQLIAAVDLAGRAEPEHQVLQGLATAAGEVPDKAIRVLRVMLDRAREPWKVLVWGGEIRAVLTAVLGSRDERAANNAVDLIHQLGARGVRDFADLVREGR